MKKICELCKHWVKDNKYVSAMKHHCAKEGSFDRNDGYGAFKLGARCVHDHDLKDLFEPIDIESEKEEKERYYELWVNQKGEIRKLNDENSKLRSLINK